MQWIDINIAAYTSELGFLAHPVGPHAQSAEMSNQSLNPLALAESGYGVILSKPSIPQQLKTLKTDSTT